MKKTFQETAFVGHVFASLQTYFRRRLSSVVKEVVVSRRNQYIGEFQGSVILMVNGLDVRFNIEYQMKQAIMQLISVGTNITRKIQRR